MFNIYSKKTKKVISAVIIIFLIIKYVSELKVLYIYISVYIYIYIYISFSGNKYLLTKL